MVFSSHFALRQSVLPSHIATDKIPVEFCHSSGGGGGYREHYYAYICILC